MLCFFEEFCSVSFLFWVSFSLLYVALKCSYNRSFCKLQGSTVSRGNCHLKATIPHSEDNVTCEDGYSSVVRAPQPPPPVPVPPSGAQNVVLLVVDDLRPELGGGTAYNQSQVQTPNIDRFAATALTFTQAYCQFSHCSPSRNSFLSGRSPQTTGVYNFIDDFREPGHGMNWTTLPQFFKRAGYTTVGGGKIFHPNKPRDNDMPFSWDNYYFANGDDKGCRENETIYNNVCPSAEDDDAFYDYQLAVLAARQIIASKSLGRPFFVGAGLRRPHRVWHVPKRFYDLYDNNGSNPIDMKLAAYPFGPSGMPELAYITNAWPSFSYNQSVPIPDQIAALGRWGYYAATSFTDHNIGIILQAIAADDYVFNNTIVLLTGDHGWELGEHGEWCKRTNFEIGLRVPLMIRSPFHKHSSYGQWTPHFFDLLDVYRTLVGLAYAGVPPAKIPVIESTVEGQDLSRVFADVGGTRASPLKNVSFSQMARCPAPGTLGPNSACNEVQRRDIKYMGYSVRVAGWRYTAWIEFNGTANRGIWRPTSASNSPDILSMSAGNRHRFAFPDFLQEELYSHVGDDGTAHDAMDAYENKNLVGDPQHASMRQELFSLLDNRFNTPPV
eukprot:m.527055 g.527055  ORF g.527055 m.527055 type:complete len:610 (-) comp22008_c0_seq7:1261-3090(-)